MKRLLVPLALVAAVGAPATAPANADSMSYRAVTFSGPYAPRAGTLNKSDICHAATNTGSVNTCRFEFPTPRQACIPEPTTNGVLGRLYIGPYGIGVTLYKVAPGVFEGHGVDLGGTTPTIYDVHVSVEGLCDDETVTVDPIGLMTALENGPARFSGYAHV